jgi:UDP-3-O-[3-hydroxymyristoyl] N-acetylglucosamine deacetylase
LIGEFTGFKSGHYLNNCLLRAMLAEEASYEAVEFDDRQRSPVSYQVVAPV